ncbi:predicted protein [Naegleria gruberi]|uniref:Predicted protein n=1 Tax=Naegleria gruberi TaxID=5762 RepID=D2V3R2_NAEGR|nr:uncharacterized protein NAEGRDRAFT_57031 [Naegleria gruberi]EFC48678.1 predicted protein [Naegleria gruberi]|eukprot:XP_002681422.1 predicted protein [Naegleria gruberi strain NEG-M]
MSNTTDTHSNLEVIQQHDNSSVSVSPLSPMPLLADSGNLDNYKDQFIAIIKEGSSELLDSEKECFDILGTCPKSNTKAAYWYGKYGGPFTWKYTGVPIDDLDLVCRMHDQRLPLKFVKKLVNLIRKHYGDKQLSKDALSYIKKIDGIGFRIIEPIYMTFFGCF